MAHILIIEDDPTLQEAYSFILTARGHDVASAYDGNQGLLLDKKQSYDIILLDVHMPVMDGLEFLASYQPELPENTKVILFSNMVEPEINKQALALGAYKCVLKSSMTPSAMLELIKSALA